MCDQVEGVPGEDTARWSPRVKRHVAAARRIPRTTSHPRAVRGALRALLLCQALLIVASCGVAPGRQGAQRGSEPSQAPSWAREPLGSETLDRIERWLVENPNASAHWRNEAYLKLAESRLAFGANDRTSGSQASARANSEFERVLADPAATTVQKRRAERGLSQASAGITIAAPVPAASGNIVARAQWGALPPRTTDMTRHRGAYSWITVHHSALDGGNGSLGQSVEAVKRIQRDHVANRAYGDIGYHYLIDPAGRVFEGRSLEWQGGHAGTDGKGRNNNPQNVGICLLGDFESTAPTPAAIATLDRMVSEIRGHYRLPASAVKPHSFWKDTLCPGRNMGPWLRRQS